MKISELKQREDIYSVLSETLETYYNYRYSKEIRVSSSENLHQCWHVCETLNSLHCSNLGPRPRRYLSNEFRHSPIWYRKVPQYFLGLFITTPLVLGLVSKMALWVEPPLPDAQDSLIIPGNRRIRIFNFASGVVTAIAKNGYDDFSLKKEISVRYKTDLGPFLPISDADNNCRWFEEPIISGFSLPRCPPFAGKARYEKEAVSKLSLWQENSMSASAPSSYVETLSESITKKGEAAKSIFPSFKQELLVSALDFLRKRAIAYDKVELVFSHGDFQPGNVLVDQKSKKVWIIDWEYAAYRSRYYDFFVWSLLSRYPSGLKKRLENFRKLGVQMSCGPLARLTCENSNRDAAFATFLMEELDWHLDEDLDPANSLHSTSATEKFLKALPF